MSGPERSELADLLEELKQRSGRSYSALAHRSGLSRSSVHRYCQGSTVPPTFGAVELIAHACGVVPGDARLDRLYRAWQRANGVGSAAPGAEPEPSAGAEPEDAPSPPPPVRVPLYARAGLRSVVLLIAFVLATVASAASYDPDRDGRPKAEPLPGESQPQGAEGPVWKAAGQPDPVPKELYGMNVGSSSGEMPDFRTGSVRLWNSQTRWGNLEPRRGHYEWDNLDRAVGAARKEKLPVLFTIGGTPPWATVNDGKADFGDSVAAPPDDLDDWERFVGKLTERYKGRIEAYELWDYPNYHRNFAGTMDRLAEMVRSAKKVIRRTDPEATVVCPSFGELWTERGRNLLREFVRTGAYEDCQAAAFKLPPRRADGPPEESIDVLRKIWRILYEGRAVGLPVWNTGPDKDVALRPRLDGRRARNYAVRFYLAAIYSWHWDLRRAYFYSWGSADLPLVVELLEGPPTPAARRIERLQRMLDGTRLASCGRGAQMRLADDAYTCRFERNDTTLRVYWTKRGRAETVLPKDALRILRLDGTTDRAEPESRFGFGEEPVFVESG